MKEKKCNELSNSVVINVDDNNLKNASKNIVIENNTGTGKLYICGENISDSVGNIRENKLESIDLYLDNINPTISLGNYNGNEMVNKQVTIPILINDKDSGIKKDSFTVDDIIVIVGTKEITNNITLSKIDNNNYNLTIKNDNINGEISLKIIDNKILDNALNGNKEVILDTNIVFNNIYTITYNANGGNNAPNPQIKNHGVTLTISNTKPIRTGYTFLGWSTSKDATSALYTAGSSYNGNATITLYAVWKINTYTISYNGNGGIGTPTSQTKTHGTTLTLSSTKPTRTGYSFLGWSTSKDATSVAYAAEASYNGNATITLYAVWQINTYTISYNANGGSGAPSAQTKTHDIALTLSSTKPTRANYTFLGWSIDKSSSTTLYKPGGNFTLNNTTTLYAQWQQMHTLPIFTYTGEYELVKDDDTIIAYGKNSKVVIPSNYQTYTGNWKIRFLTSGKITFHELRSAANGIDAFLVGGGGNGGGTYARGAGYYGYAGGGGGGGGGYRTTKKGITVSLSTYDIVIGSAGAKSTGFGQSANGGTNGKSTTCLHSCGSSCAGAPGTGGAQGGYGEVNCCGNYEVNVNGRTGGLEFDDSIYNKYYGGGGGGGHGHNGEINVIGSGGTGGIGGGGYGNSQYRKGILDFGHNGQANTGGGGGGGSYILVQVQYGTYFGSVNSSAQNQLRGISLSAGTGGSGIVIIRNKR